MWKNFLSSLALLAIAMMAALYSSSASNQGRGVPAGVSALIALVLAIWVGIRFVPRLAKSVDWNWVPIFAHYKVTKDGLIFLITVAVVVFAAVNTSNNLLYMVLSGLLAVFLISGFLATLNFKNLEIELQLPPRCHVGDTVSCAVRIRNLRRVFPMFSVRIEPMAASPFHFGPFYFDAVEPLVESGFSGETVLPRRGRYHVVEVQGVSRFPFGLLAKTRSCNVDATILCFPKILPVEQLDVTALDDQGEIQRYERGSGNDLHTIRDYLSSDGARHVHWKASAKTNSLKTREYAADASRRVVLALDRYGNPEDSESFEVLVSHAASSAVHLIHEGAEIVLVSDEWRSAEGSSRMVLDSILEYLATVELSARAPMPDVDPSQGSYLLSLRQGRG